MKQMKCYIFFNSWRRFVNKTKEWYKYLVLFSFWTIAIKLNDYFMQFFRILNWFNVFAVPRAIIQNKEISSYNYKPITNHLKLPSKTMQSLLSQNKLGIIVLSHENIFRWIHPNKFISSRRAFIIALMRLWQVSFISASSNKKSVASEWKWVCLSLSKKAILGRRRSITFSPARDIEHCSYVIILLWPAAHVIRRWIFNYVRRFRKCACFGKIFLLPPTATHKRGYVIEKEAE